MQHNQKTPLINPFKPKSKLSHILTVIRSLGSYLVLAISTLIWLVLLTTTYPLPWKYKTCLLRLWGAVSYYNFCLISGIRVKINGLENLKHPDLKHKSIVYMCNHQSTWETLAISRIVSFQCCVLKKNILKIPFFGWALIFTPYFGIDRSKPIQALKKILKIGSKYLQQGLSIMIYPEGTRVQPGEQKPINPGAAKLAKMNNSPIIPIVHNAGFSWPPKQFLIYPGIINMTIGEPIFNTKDTNPKQITSQISEWMWEQRCILEKNP